MEKRLYEIRGIVESDYEAVSELLVACYRFIAQVEGLSPEQLNFLLAQRASVESVRVDAHHQTFIAAYVENRLAGIAAISGNEITRLFVDPQWHRNGIGRRLFDDAATHIAQAGHKTVTLGSFDSAVPFYQRMGMSVIGWIQHRTPVLAGRRVVIMQKRLSAHGDAP